MEHAKHPDIVIERGPRVQERYGWIILLTSAILGIFAAVVTAFPPGYILSSPLFEGTYPIMGALAITSVGFNIFALVMVLIPYRRYERWAWYTLWLLPLMWLSQFVLALDLYYYYLVLAVLSSLGLVLPYRRFFASSEESSV